ncbi:MAG: DUF4147 domain-containing protein, partial [Chloroflexota bacterium]
MPNFSDHKKHIFAMIEAAVAAVDPFKSTYKALRIDGELIKAAGAHLDCSSGRTYLVGIGKAAVPMANAAIDKLGDRLDSGVVVTKKGQTELAKHDDVQTHFAAHPVPDESSVTAADAVIELLEKTQPEDVVLFLISGGASALCTRPLLSMERWQTLSQDLLASGCTIQEFNTVRKQLDAVKGGGLGELAAPAKIATLVLSDVIGNPIDMIGSGPTVPNPQPPADALAILQKYSIQNDEAFQLLESLQQTEVDFDSPFKFVGDLPIATAAACQAAKELGYEAHVVSTTLEGEAKKVGEMAVEKAKTLAAGTCLIYGGETTVTIQGDGIGGRNQELALSAAIGLDGIENTIIATYATDGDDGPTNAAGAIVNGGSVKAGKIKDLEAADFLANNDSYTYFN